MSTWKIFEGIGELRHTTAGKAISILVTLSMIVTFSSFGSYASGDTSAAVSTSSASSQAASTQTKTDSSATGTTAASTATSAATSTSAATTATTTNTGTANQSANAGSSASTTESPVAVTVETNEALVNFDVPNAYVTVSGQVVSASNLKVTLHKDFTFAVAANTGYQLTAVTAHSTSTGTDVDISKDALTANADGTYTVKDDYVDNYLTIKAETTKKADETASATTTPVTSSTVVEANDNTQSDTEDATATSYTVTFTSDGTTVATQSVESGQTAVAPANPSKDGYYFLGWCTQSDQSKTVDVAKTPVTADTTYVAKFTQNATKTITINYVYSDGTTVAAQPMWPTSKPAATTALR